jgi:hypothetical protein
VEEKTYRCMLDGILVDHQHGTITPFDLKTTSKDEDRFDESIYTYRYDIQAESYKDVLEAVVRRSEYKDYKIKNFLFIPINRFNNCPMIWEYDRQQIVQERYGRLAHTTWERLFDDVSFAIEKNQFRYDRDTVKHDGIKKVWWIY